MARRTPDKSKISLPRTVAFARKTKADGSVDPGETEDPPAKAEPKAEPAKVEPAKAVEPAPTKPADSPVPDPIRARADTLAMPAVTGFGAPPEIPVLAAAPSQASAVEDPTYMPGPREIPGGAPDDRAPAPGLVPPGDSRSLRKQSEFALVYRRGNAVISRFGAIGTRGQWRVVEYPTTASASHSYAKECSRFVSEGFSDYRA